MPEGLRERKRTAAMLRIQSVALDLFEARGFDEVTIEEIADASDVSPSSVYRYFGTKEQLVLWDEWDPVLPGIAEAAVDDPVPLAGLRRAIDENVGRLSAADERRLIRRLRLAASTPELERGTIIQAYEASRMLEQVLAKQLGREVDDLEVQVFAHAFTGGLLGMFHHWAGTGFRAPMREILARVFEIFEEGLDIVTASDAARVTARDRPTTRPA